MPSCELHRSKTTTKLYARAYAPFVLLFVKGMEENLSAKISFSFLSIYKKMSLVNETLRP